MLLTSVNDKIIKCVNVIIILSMILLVTCISLQILNRFVLKVPMPWTEEFARYFFVWLAMFGSAKALREKSHIFVDILDVLVKGVFSKACAILADIVCLIFSATLLYVSIPWIIKNFDVGTESVPSLSMGMFYLCIPLSAVLLILFGVEVFIMRVKTPVKKAEED